MKKKMYKSKKHWVIAGLATVAILGSHGLVLADETSAIQEPTKQESTITVDQPDASSSVTEEVKEATPVETFPDLTSTSEPTNTVQLSGTTQSTSPVMSEVVTSMTSESTVVQSVTSESATAATSEVVEGSTVVANQSENTSSVVQRPTSADELVPEKNATEVATDIARATGNETAQPVQATLDSKGIKITFSGNKTADEQVKFAVWSDKNGQDDLVWYDADAKGAAYVQLSRHKDYGKYNIHTYAFSGKGPRGINAMTLTVPEPDVKVSTTKKSATQYEVSVTNVPETITDVTVPVWSSKNDQDDLIWYKATKSGQGTYTVLVDTTMHHNDTGHYNAHVYGHSMVTGGLVGLKVSGFDNVDTRTNATIAVVNYSENKTSFDVVVTSDSNTKTINKVSVAVWSEDKGQDDLKWYTPTVKNNQAKMTVDIANHSNTSDKYNVHVYIDYADGSRVGTVVGAYKITKPSDLNRPEADTKVATDLTDKGIAIQVSSNQVKDYRDVRFAVWSEDKGQDDLKWYNADSQGKAVAAYENHAGYGKYNVHTYMVSNGKMIGLNATSFTMPNPSAQTEIIKVDDLTYKVTVKNVPAYIDSVTVPVWSDRGDQDDIVWTKTDKENGIYIALVSLKEHHYDDGHYSAHIYGHSKIGNQTVGMAVTSGFTVPLADVSDKQQAVQVETRYKGTGNYEVNVTNIRQSGKLKIAIWSSKNDQDDLRWYETTPANHQATLRFNVTNHKDTGVYNIHIYQENGKKLEFLTSSNVQVDRANYDTPYYSQRDGRWASRWYGVSNLAATGCVPTTMAMVLTSLKGAQVLPTQVADYLYNQTVEFNRGTAGTTGQGILMAAKEWGVTATPLGTKNNLIQALKDGYHVLGAVQNDIFVMHGSHELVLKGYKAGKTHVSDPYTPSYSGWYSIDQLWNEQSHYSDDTRNIGAPFIKITDI